MSSWILAIDFGTSYTVAAAKVDDRASEVVEIQGERRVPSVVLVLPDGEFVVGRAADDLSVSHPGSTLRALKNRLGDTAPVVLGGRPYQVVHLVAALLREVERQVTRQMGGPPSEVRLTHPASWNRPRQNRLLEAAAKAGIDQPVLVPEPVAAAVSHASDFGLDAGRFIAVYDLGGGTFDCAVLRGGDFAVVGHSTGDQNIGGELFDELLMNRIGEELDPAVWESIQIGEQAIWLQVRATLRNEARKAKEALSSNPYVDVIVALPAGLLQVRLARSDFEEIARPHLAETISQLERCIADAGLRPSELSAISLVGGASRSPLVEELVVAAFPDVVISRRGDPKAAVAIGAALAPRPRAGDPAGSGRSITQPASPGTAPQPVRLAPPAPATAVFAAPSPYQAPPLHQRPVSPVLPTGPPRAEPSQAGVKRRRTLAVVAGSLAAVVLAAVLWSASRDSGTEGNDEQAAATSERVADSQSSAASTSATTETASAGGSTTPSVAQPTESFSTVSRTTVPATTVPATTVDPATATTIPQTTVLSLEPRPPSGPLGTVVQTLTGHSALVYSAAFSPDGLRLATGGSDYTAKIWDLATGAVLWNLTAHTDDVNSVAFDPTGTRLVTASADGTARVWDVGTGAELAVLQHDADAAYFTVNGAQFNGDGSLIITASNDDTARLWDAATGAQLFVLSHDSFVNTATFSPDGTMVVTASLDGTAKIWSVATGEPIVTLTGHTQDVESAAFDSAGARIVTASEDNTAKIWNATTGELQATLFGHVGSVSGATFSADGTRIVTASEDATAKLWDAATFEMLFSLPHADIVESATFSPDGAEFVTLGGDYVGHLWNTADGSLLLDLENVVYATQFSPDGATLATPAISGDASVQIWSIASP